MAVEIDCFVVGPLETNCYVVRGRGECWIVDPSMGPGRVISHVQALGLTVSRILLTHGHGDHIGGVTDVRAAFGGAEVCCPRADIDMLTDPALNLSQPFGFRITAPAADVAVKPGQTLGLEQTDWQVLDTSGHTPGGVSYYCREAAVVLVGDALFAGSIGRVDIPGASASGLLRNIRENLLSLPASTRVLPGHGPETSVGAELATNPFFAVG